ncbi:MAG: AAA family ATPase [Planctomycetota bacterium]
MNRSIEHQLLFWKNRPQRKPLIIRGLRQVGKTYSIEAFGQAHFKNTVTFDFEKERGCRNIFSGDLGARAILSQLEVYREQRIIPGETLVFFDEIQACPRALVALRYFHEELPDLHIAAAGSLLEFAMEDVSFPVGRVEFLWMHPLSFGEFLSALGHNLLIEQRPTLDTTHPASEIIHQKFTEILRQYFIVGGMPEAVKAFAETNSFEEAGRVHRSLTAAFTQDFSKYGGRMDKDCLAHVFERIPAHAGEQIKYARLYPEKRIETIQRAMRVLEQAMIIRRVTASSAQGLPLGASASDKIFKCVFADIGLLRHLSGLPAKDVLSAGNLLDAFRGGLAEQFVGQELLSERNGSENGKLHYWARANRNSSAEVDYLLVRDGRIFPVEVKSGSVGKLQSMRIFLEEHPNAPMGFVFHGGNAHDLPENRIRYLPLYTRMSEPNSQE